MNYNLHPKHKLGLGTKVPGWQIYMKGWSLMAFAVGLHHLVTRRS